MGDTGATRMSAHGQCPNVSKGRSTAGDRRQALTHQEIYPLGAPQLQVLS